MNVIRNYNINATPKEIIDACQGKTATREVLGSLMENPQLVLKYPLSTDDFVETIYKIIYAAIYNLARDGAETLDVPAIEAYLQENYPAKYKIFTSHGGAKYLNYAMELNNPDNLKMYYDEVRKYSLLREYLRNGIDVGEFFNPNEVDAEVSQKIADNFGSVGVEQLGDYFRGKILRINNAYSNRTLRTSIKAGGADAKIQKELWKESSSLGISYASNYLNDATDGIRQKRYTVISAGTGAGKTRMTIANIGHSFSPKYYDLEQKKWVINDNGTQNKCLYIGTEMELREEVEPILEAYISGVPESHILHPDDYEDGEEERVDKAIEVLSSGYIYMEYMPNYCLATLEEVISSHVYEHGVTHVFFDYIHLTTALAAEYTRSSGLKDREDLVLANVSNKLKEWTEKYNISIDTWTQVNGDFAQDAIRDQRLVRGSKAIIDKADVAGILSLPSEAEKRKIDGLLRHKILHHRLMCLSIYKNRGKKYTNIKIWLDVNYDTMRVRDLFVTDYAYEPITDINKVVVRFNEDKQVFEHYKSYDVMLRVLNNDVAKEEEPVIKNVIEGPGISLSEEEFLEEETKTVYNIDDDNSNFVDSEEDDEVFEEDSDGGVITDDEGDW